LQLLDRAQDRDPDELAFLVAADMRRELLGVSQGNSRWIRLSSR
jgi:hypothetical protein